jgi:hypothetical protein
VIEPSENENAREGAQAGTVVNLADWSDGPQSSLVPHEPETTEIIIMLETEH